MKLLPRDLDNAHLANASKSQNYRIIPDADVPVSLEQFEAVARFIFDSARTGRVEETSGTDTIAAANNILAVRTDVAEILAGESLPVSPVLYILLDLFVSEEVGRNVTVTDISIAAKCPSTTGLRWFRTLLSAGLVQRTNDSSDQRRSLVSLTPKGRHLTLRCLRAHSKASVPEYVV